ncbi:hypothetical protein [Mycoplasmopsis agassizii]|uniref:Lipoprotein n=1 Tax=Mycoplasmopsis agassizii TaxID=33922 RepID=A0ABX4H531_9BACT|nr:hypothetical protein [Mycoplasmopsis agassizii]PAF54883.1 hypothetical protein CJF60_04060 [Mycoplasmopsis agassizii]SMC20408.1 hypothetical protein SAMN02745179_01019 [Mycoplasmopsis agassizii]
MSSLKKKSFLIFTFVSLFSSTLVAISCSKHIVDINDNKPIDVVDLKDKKPDVADLKDKKSAIFFNISMVEQNIVNGEKELGVITFDPETVSKIYGSDITKLEPIVLKTKQDLNNLMDNWKKIVLKKFNSDKNFADSLNLTKDVLVQDLLSNKNDIINKFNDSYFEKNIIVIDFGGEIQPLVNDDKEIKNLNRIWVKKKKNEIILDYFWTSSSPIKENDTHAYSAVYFLNKKTFNINPGNYIIIKKIYGYIPENKMTKRFLNYYSYITQDLSKYEDQEHIIWDKKSLSGDYATTIIKTKSELNNLLENFTIGYKKEFSKEFPKETYEKINNDFSDEFFNDNVLVLLSGSNWQGHTWLMYDYVEESYDLKLEGNNLKFEIFFLDYPPEMPEEVPDKVNANYAYNSAGWHRYNDNYSHTQFLKLPKSLIKDLNKLRTTIEFDS